MEADVENALTEVVGDARKPERRVRDGTENEF